MPVCETCGVEFEEGKKHEHKGKLYVYKGKAVCESCLVDIGVSPGDAEPYETYIKLHTDFNRI